MATEIVDKEKAKLTFSLEKVIARATNIEEDFYLLLDNKLIKEYEAIKDEHATSVGSIAGFDLEDETAKFMERVKKSCLRLRLRALAPAEIEAIRGLVTKEYKVPKHADGETSESILSSRLVALYSAMIAKSVVEVEDMSDGSKAKSLSVEEFKDLRNVMVNSEWDRLKNFFESVTFADNELTAMLSDPSFRSSTS